MADHSSDDENFILEMAGRELLRAQRLRGQQAHTLGRLIVALREKQGLSRIDLMMRSGLPYDVLFFLERELSSFDELGVDLLEQLGSALGVRPVILAEAACFRLNEIPQVATMKRIKPPNTQF